MPGCQIVATAKPQVWKDDYGWNCDQTVDCLKCSFGSSMERLAEEVTWSEAMEASTEGRPVHEVDQ